MMSSECLNTLFLPSNYDWVIVRWDSSKVAYLSSSLLISGTCGPTMYCHEFRRRDGVTSQRYPQRTPFRFCQHSKWRLAVVVIIVIFFICYPQIEHQNDSRCLTGGIECVITWYCPPWNWHELYWMNTSLTCCVWDSPGLTGRVIDNKYPRVDID